MASLNTYVHVDGVAYGPGDDIPDAVAAKILNPAVWAVAPPAADADHRFGSGVLDAASLTDPAVAVPARGGPGSGRSAWETYATSKGVAVTGDMKTREDIIAACEVADVPVDSATD